MPLILNIETAVEQGSVCLSDNASIIQSRTNDNQKEHAAWLHVAIKEMMMEARYEMKDLKAVAVSIGPGSYTGLRISLSAAKGICYALKIPLLSLGTLEIMAAALLKQPVYEKEKMNAWLCPMIDARRMEVYFAVFDQQLSTIHQPAATILANESLTELLTKKKMLFFGNGSTKFRAITNHPNAFFVDFTKQHASDMVDQSYQRFLQQQFADLAYTEPLYIKEFYSPSYPTPK